MKKNKLRYKCFHCSRRFKSWQERNKHAEEDHQPPKETTEIALKEEINRTLLKGSKMKIGDVIFLTQKGVIVKITYTEDSPDVVVVIRITKENYSRTE